MNKKIKIIELLQDFADEKEIIMPKYIRYWDRIGHKDEVMLVCKANIIKKLDDCRINLNDEVEILEDNTEEIEEKSNFENMGYEIAQAYFEFYKGIAKALTEKRKESEDKQ